MKVADTGFKLSAFALSSQPSEGGKAGVQKLRAEG
jgi:hypothetical protein